MKNLSWNDLFVDASLLDFKALFSEWPGLIKGEVAPIGASVFGDLFYQNRSGAVFKLDVLEGGVSQIADTMQQFSELMNSEKWREYHLLSEGVALLKQKGLERSALQFFGFAPHPALAGKIDWSRVMLLDAVVWNSICAQSLGIR
ncbi:hypothetical protein E2K99_00445 [Herbaspirillum huttiense]|uniref:hypothetical protein n=1 Tax=Herbaspirillum huttiense TaxID=863372 RepID=UPI001064AC60|nr:hypothetical protein [Herbaspirillum huttiense]QBP73581.1 hypothetical protein E2K99_00445 [Herbaspirillum huttiense]